MKRINREDISRPVIKRLHRDDLRSCPDDEMENNINHFTECGNKELQKEDYEKAIKNYMKVLSISDNCVDINKEICDNISLAYVRLEKYEEALHFCELSIEHDSASIKTRKRKIKVLLHLGRLGEANIEAMEMFVSGTSGETDIVLSEIFETLGDVFIAKGRIENDEQLCLDSLSNYTRSIILQKRSVLYVKRAKVYLFLGRVLDALKDGSKAVDIDPGNINGRKLKLKIMEDTDSDLKSLIEEALIIHGLEVGQEISRKLGRLYFLEALEQMNSNVLTGALESLTRSIIYMPENAYAYENRAHVSFQLHDVSSAFHDCSEAIERGLDGSHIRALRAKCSLELGRIKEAVEDAAKAYYLNPVIEYFHLIQEAKNIFQKLSKPQPLTYYSELELGQHATLEEIRKQYLKLCLKYHPDKLVNASEGQKLEGEEKFKRILGCYNILSNPKYRKEYDDYLARKRDV